LIAKNYHFIGLKSNFSGKNTESAKIELRRTGFPDFSSPAVQNTMCDGCQFIIPSVATKNCDPGALTVV
jgi:hypothetical protein